MSRSARLRDSELLRLAVPARPQFSAPLASSRREPSPRRYSRPSPFRRLMRLEAAPAGLQIHRVVLDGEPVASQFLARLDEDVAPGGRVEHEVAFVDQEAYEAERQLDREAGQVRLIVGFLAPPQVIALRIAVAVDRHDGRL